MTRAVRGRGLAALAPWLFAALGACSSSPPREAQSPDPPLDEPAADSGGAAPNAVQKPSSDKVQKGIEALEKQDFAGAKAVLSEARAEAPKDPQAAHYLGVALEQLGDLAGAEREYRAALELDPNLAESLQNLSAILVDAGKPKDALPLIERALKIQPKNPDLLLNRALALETVGELDEAVKAYGQAVAARSDSPELRLAYADLLIQAERKDEAAEQLKAAVASDDPVQLAAAARLFGKLGKPADCVAALDRAIEKKPIAEMYVRRGVCRHDAKDDAGAKADYELALKVDPRSAPAHYYLGRHLGKKDKKNAEQHLTKAVELTKGEGDLGKAAKQALADLKKK